MALDIKPKSSCTYTEVSLGEIMLRLDPVTVGCALLAVLTPGKVEENTTLPGDYAGASVSRQLWSVLLLIMILDT